MIEVHRGISGGRICLAVQKSECLSPLRAPFGSVEVQGPYSATVVHQLLDEVDHFAKAHKLHTIRVVHPPDGYDPDTSYLIAKALQARGFHLLHQDLNFHLEVGLEFKTHLHRSERWKLNKSKRCGYSFHPISQPDWDVVFPFLLQSRERKGFALSMNREELQKAFQLFPNQYKMFCVRIDNHMVALAITVWVNSDILYVFYTADHLGHRKLSPVVLIHEGLYNYCLQHKIKLLDLGTASLKGIVNSGVATFKRNLGGVASLKQSWVKRY